MLDYRLSGRVLRISSFIMIDQTNAMKSEFLGDFSSICSS